MAVERSVSWDVEANRGQGVWAVSCRAALRAITLAAAALGVTDEVERVELLVAYGLAPQLGMAPWHSIDWERLGELERAPLALEARAHAAVAEDPAKTRQRHSDER